MNKFLLSIFSCDLNKKTTSFFVVTMLCSNLLAAAGELVKNDNETVVASGDVVACVGTNAVFTVSYNTLLETCKWQLSTDGGVNWNDLSNGGAYSGVTSSTLTISPITLSMNNNLYRAKITVILGLAVSYGSENKLTVNPNNTAGVASSTPSLCINTVLTNITHATIGATGIGTPTGLPAGVSATFGSNAITISGTPSVSGTFNYNIPLTGGCGNVNATGTITINPLPTTPTIGVITQPTCALPTGSVVLSGLPASWTLTQSGTLGATITGTGTSTTVSGLPGGTYNFAVSNSSTNCTSVASANVVINPLITNTYNGTWSNGVPNSNMNIIFNANYSSPSNLSGCSCQVISGNVVINSGHSLAITNAVTVSGGTLTFEDDASLVQINDVVNSGNITYKRETTTISKSDYTYWSSPVSPQKLYDVSPNTLSGKFYSFDAAIDNWKQENSQNLMTKGIGYIIAGPQDYGTTSPPVPPSVYEANFIGVPNNGTFSLNSISADKWYLIGNPYPSALDANAFLDANSTVLDGTIYFWTHNTAIQLASNIDPTKAGSGVYAYTSDDYATYNRVGGVGTKALAPGENSNAPSGKIAAGQSFFAATKASIPSNQIVFNNSMRAGLGGIPLDNSQFFKMNASSKKTEVTERNRVWLNLTNTQGAFKQTLVGYVTGATNGYEGAYDGESFDGNDYVDFYSIDQDKNLTIQGRALPFDVTDAVPLGYKTTIAGTFSIGIDHIDGLLASQDVLLEDKVTQTVQNLKEGAYSFTTATGSFNNRFVLRYANKTLGTADFKTLENSVLVSTKNKQITINSSVETIDKIQVYDMLGRQIYKKLNVDTTEFSIPNLVIEEQVLIVKVILKNGNTVTNKIILK